MPPEYLKWKYLRQQSNSIRVYGQNQRYASIYISLTKHHEAFLP